MNVIKNIKNIQNEKTSKNISLPLSGEVYENDIVKVLPHKKTAIVQKINTKPRWNNIFESHLKILNYVCDKYGDFYFTGYFDKNINIQGYGQVFKGEISEEGFTDIFVARMSHGEIIYIKFIPGLKNDKASSIIVDSHNDIYICGYYTDSVTFDTNYLSAEGNQKNLFIAKLDGKTWEWIWVKDTWKEDHDCVCKKIQIYNNFIYVCGYFEKEIQFTTIPPTEIELEGINTFVMKLNAIDGDIKWIQYSKSNNIFKPKDMLIKDKKIYITGYAKGHIIFDKIEYKIERKNTFIACLSIGGVWLWERIFDSQESYGKRIKIDRDNNIYILTEYQKWIELGNIKFECKNNCNIIFKINNYGELEWYSEITAHVDDFELDIQYFLYLTGSFENSISIGHKKYEAYGKKSFLLKLNGSGTINSFDIYQTCLDKIQIYNFNGINIGGFNSDRNYILVKYYYDDRHLKCLGIVRTPFLSKNNDIIDIDFPGYLSTGYKELEPGYDYYIQESGEINIIPTDFYFGTALTTDKMMIFR